MEREEEEKRRQAILEVREQNKKIAQLIIQGTAKHETVQARGTDDAMHSFEVFAISDADLAELLDSTGMDMKDIGNREKLAANMKFLQKGAGLVTGVPDVAKALMPLESLKMILKSFELSGLSGVPKPV